MSDYLPSEDEVMAASPAAAARAPRAPAARFVDRLPPHSIEAEQGVLGCVLLDPEPSLDLLSDQLSVAGAAAFYDVRHQQLFQTASDMWDAHVKIDLITFPEELKKRGVLEAVGGLAYIASLPDTVPSAAHLEHYVGILLEKWTARRILTMGTDIVARVHAGEVGVDELAATVQMQALAITDVATAPRLKSIKPIVREYITLLEKRVNGRQQITGIRTGLHMLDNMTCGLQAGELVLIAARPSVGKTALGTTLAIEALRARRKVAFFSLEMNEQSLAQRIIGAVARVDSQKLRNGFLAKSDQLRLTKAVEEIGTWGDTLFIDDRSVLTGRDLFTAVRRSIRDRGTEMVVLDYVQLMHAVNTYGTREGEMAEVADWVKRVAKDLNVAVVALAQTNKEAEKDRNPREPRMSDIRESDRFCQNADVVGLMWSPKLDDESYMDMRWIKEHTADDPKENDGWDGEKLRAEGNGGAFVEFPAAWRKELTFVELVVAKNRNGATGPCQLVLQRRTTRFSDAYRPDYGQKAKQQELKGEEV